MQTAVWLCILAFGLTFSTTRVLANPVGNSCEEIPWWIPVWDPPSGLGYVHTLELATAVGVELCNRTLTLTKFCVKAVGHVGFCRQEENISSRTPEQQTNNTTAEAQDTGQRRASLFQGKLNNKSMNYQVAWRSEQGCWWKLPCCLCGKHAKNRKWLLVEPTTIESATLQRPDGEGDVNCTLPCCHDLRFQVHMGSTLLLVDKQLTWPLENKSCPQPSLDLLVGCYKCVQKLPTSAPANDLAPPSYTKEQLIQMLEEARKFEPMAQQGAALAQRLKMNVEGTFMGNILKLPAYLAEKARRQLERVRLWKEKYHQARPSDKQLDSLLRNHGSVQEVKKVLAEVTLLKGVISSTASLVEQAPALRQKVQDLQDKLLATNANSVEASTAAEMVAEAQATITTRSQDLVSDALCKLEAAQQQNELAEDKLEQLQLKYLEMMEYCKEVGGDCEYFKPTRNLTESGGLCFTSTHAMKGKSIVYNRDFMAKLMQLASRYNDTPGATAAKFYDFLSLATSLPVEVLKAALPLPKQTQMARFKRATGKGLRDLIARMLKGNVSFSLEIDGADMLRLTREMIHVNVPTATCVGPLKFLSTWGEELSKPTAERKVAGLYTVNSSSGVHTAEILQQAVLDLDASLAMLRTFSSDSTASMDTALVELQRLKNIEVGKLMAEGKARPCTVFTDVGMPALNQFFFQMCDDNSVHPILIVRAKDIIHMWKNAEKSGMQNGVGSGTRPGCVDETPVRVTANLVKSELLSWARIAQNNKTVVHLIQYFVAQQHQEFKMIAGVVNHRMLILPSLADARCENRVACLQALDMYIDGTDETTPYHKHAIELRAGLRDPVMAALEESVRLTISLHQHVYRVFQDEDGFILYRTRSELLEAVGRLSALKADPTTTEVITTAFNAAWDALSTDELIALIKRLRSEEAEYTAKAEEKEAKAEKKAAEEGERRAKREAKEAKRVQKAAAIVAARAARAARAAPVAHGVTPVDADAGNMDADALMGTTGATDGVMGNAPASTEDANNGGGAEVDGGALEEDDEDDDDIDADDLQRSAHEVILILDDDEEGVNGDWSSGAPVSCPLPLNSEGKEDLAAWKVAVLAHTINRALRNYTVQAEYVVENARVYLEEFPLRIAAYYHPTEGLALLKYDCHKMGRCLGSESELCEWCIKKEAVYSPEEQTDVAVRSWGFFHHPSHQAEISEALCMSKPEELIKMGESPARGEVPAKTHCMSWLGEELTKFYVVSFMHVSVQTMALERALGFAKRSVFKSSVSSISEDAILVVYNKGRDRLNSDQVTSGMQMEYRQEQAIKKKRALFREKEGMLSTSRFHDKVGDVASFKEKIYVKKEGERAKQVMLRVARYQARLEEFFHQQPLPKIKVIVANFLGQLEGVTVDEKEETASLIVDVEATNLTTITKVGQLKERMVLCYSESRFSELFTLADGLTRDEVSTYPADLSSFDKTRILDIAVSLPLLNRDQLRSLTAEQFAWLRVATLTSVLEILSVPKDGAKLQKMKKDELVNKLLDHLHPPVDEGETHESRQQEDLAAEILRAAETTEGLAEEVPGPEGAPEGIVADSSGEQEAVTSAANEVIPTEHIIFEGQAYTQEMLKKFKVPELKAMCKLADIRGVSKLCKHDLLNKFWQCLSSPPAHTVVSAPPGATPAAPTTAVPPSVAATPPTRKRKRMADSRWELSVNLDQCAAGLIKRRRI